MYTRDSSSDQSLFEERTQEVVSLYVYIRLFASPFFCLTYVRITNTTKNSKKPENTNSLNISSSFLLLSLLLLLCFVLRNLIFGRRNAAVLFNTLENQLKCGMLRL